VLSLLDGSRELPEALALAAAPADDAHADAPTDGTAREDAGTLVALLATGGCLDVLPAERVPETLGPDVAALSLLARAAPGAAAAALARRRASRVRVVGAGRVGAPLAALLAAAGVGSVAVDDAGPTRVADLAPAGLLARDLGRARGATVARRLPRQPSGGGRPRGAGPHDLVLLTPVGPGAPDPADAQHLLREGVPHLAAGVRENTGWVGPLVLPGRGPCLECLERHRTDRDPGWPLVAAQLAVPAYGVVDPCNVALAALVAAVTALQALALLDAEPGQLPPAVSAGSLGGVLELQLPGWRLRRRSWAPHADCDCRTIAPAPGARTPI
jgi:hypothetical protein